MSKTVKVGDVGLAFSDSRTRGSVGVFDRANKYHLLRRWNYGGVRFLPLLHVEKFEGWTKFAILWSSWMASIQFRVGSGSFECKFGLPSHRATLTRQQFVDAIAAYNDRFKAVRESA